jgi:DNA helicase-2/ATP-dependent DNA helicase PcrA
LTYHRAKGLEFDVVFLPRVVDGELPYRSGRSVADPQEERRLFYVGITRARHWLAITWPTDGRAAVSPFIEEATGTAPPRATAKTKVRAPVAATGDPVFERLRRWRRDRRERLVVEHDVRWDAVDGSAIATARPSTPAALREISGVGPTKAERYGDEVLDLIEPHETPARR